MKEPLIKRTLTNKNERTVAEEIHKDGRLAYEQGYCENDNPYEKCSDVYYHTKLTYFSENRYIDIVMNPFKKKQPRISREIEEMAESLKRISEKLDILLKDIKSDFDTVSYRGIDFPARYVDVPYVHEDGEEEINSYTVIELNVASLIQWGIDNEEEEALCWNDVCWWALTPEEFRTLTDEELIDQIRRTNS